MESYEFSCSTVPNCGMIHPIECAPQSTFLNNMYIRSGSVPSGADQRMYDIGSFQYATQGMQSAYTVGELWVSYHVKLKKPRINPNGLSAWSHIVSSAAATATQAAPLGTTGASIRSSSNLYGIAVGSVVTTKLQIQVPGEYLVSVWATTTNASIASAPSLTLGSNLTSIILPFNNSTVGSISANTTNVGSFMGLVRCISGGIGTANEFTIGGLASMTAGNVDVIIVPVPFSIN